MDRMETFQEYARAGVPECRIVDPEARTVKVDAPRRGAYVLRGKWERGETASSGLPEGFAVRVEEILVD